MYCLINAISAFIPCYWLAIQSNSATTTTKRFWVWLVTFFSLSLSLSSSSSSSFRRYMWIFSQLFHNNITRLDDIQPKKTKIDGGKRIDLCYLMESVVFDVKWKKSSTCHTWMMIYEKRLIKKNRKRDRDCEKKEWRRDNWKNRKMRSTLLRKSPIGIDDYGANITHTEAIKKMKREKKKD